MAQARAIRPAAGDGQAERRQRRADLAAITAATTIISFKTGIHPLWLLFGGAAAGMAFLR